MILLDRRRFIGSSAAALLMSPSLLSGCRRTPQRQADRPPIPADRPLRLAIIGVANQGGGNLDAVAGEEIVAICDVDERFLEAAGARCPNARRYRDFRELLREPAIELDGVVISTPDHTHAPAAAMALRRGWGVYLEKPLAHTVEQCRALARLAEANQCVTQMGTIIHAGANYRRVVELIRSGAIGTITQVDCWCPKSWCCGQLTPGATAPAELDWELWQGPVPAVPYIKDIAPANWRRYWSYGTGTLGDMGCHILDLPFWALELNAPRADRCSVTAIGPRVDPIGCPEWLEATWVFPDAMPAGSGLDPLIVRWFDGDRVPPLVQELGAKDREDYFGRYMVCFQGTRGFLMANYDEHRILQVPDAEAPGRTIPDSVGHHREWLDALRAGRWSGEGAPLCRFEYAAPLSELVLLGTVAYRAGGSLEWDRRSGRVRGANGAAASLLHAPSRPGWPTAT